jgi:hypothetical protein
MEEISVGYLEGSGLRCLERLEVKDMVLSNQEGCLSGGKVSEGGYCKDRLSYTGHV